MTTIHDVNPEKLIIETKEELKKLPEIKPPTWSKFVKTGASRERPPTETDWWYKRAASMLRKISLLGPIGTSKLKKKYGGKKNRGHKPERFYKGSGSIIRKILQQLQKAELIKQIKKGTHKGKILTSKGQKLLNQIATKTKNGEIQSPSKKITPSKKG